MMTVRQWLTAGMWFHQQGIPIDADVRVLPHDDSILVGGEIKLWETPLQMVRESNRAYAEPARHQVVMWQKAAVDRDMNTAVWWAYADLINVLVIML